MEYSARNLEGKDYELLLEWWMFWWRRPVPRHMLPDNMSDGIMVECNGIPVCAGFVYQTASSSLWWLEYLISNPTVKDKEIRFVSIEQTIKILVGLAKEAGAKTIFTTIKNEAMIKKYEDIGFIHGDKNMTNMVFNLG